ncbi:hypothetical protein PAPYR_9109 [Paratrimastix pyriformis]|uniref:Uncharacterized protein n=1 Tax=Paratrimastix pyriformis TaxID=342808 RepID=A0ABQ8UGF6_9EUKA|nr:hypothetical protein PAPYR_9109 [Paratrimastix pyriformis]
MLGEVLGTASTAIDELEADGLPQHQIPNVSVTWAPEIAGRRYQTLLVSAHQFSSALFSLFTNGTATSLARFSLVGPRSVEVATLTQLTDSIALLATTLSLNEPQFGVQIAQGLFESGPVSFERVIILDFITSFQLYPSSTPPPSEAPYLWHLKTGVYQEIPELPVPFLPLPVTVNGLGAAILTKCEILRCPGAIYFSLLPDGVLTAEALFAFEPILRAAGVWEHALVAADKQLHTHTPSADRPVTSSPLYSLYKATIGLARKLGGNIIYV